MEKQYGKLTPEQFRQLIEVLPGLRDLAQEISTLLGTMPNWRFRELLPAIPHWYDLYERPFLNLIADAVNGMGLAGRIQVALQSPDPEAVLLDDLENDFRDVSGSVVDLGGLLRFVMPLSRSLTSIGLFGCTVSGLVALVRDSGETDALFKAVSVDRSVMACPTIASKITKAEMCGDEAFFRDLERSLRGPSKKVMISLADMRFSFFVLRELGINDLSASDLEALMVGVLGVYADSPTSAKNLAEAYHQSKKISTI